jgi:aryl-alcohol dehydrogenase-like predicted oxidoreductase
MIPLCVDQGIGIIPWSPMAHGRLTRDPATTTARSESDPFGRSLSTVTAELDRPIIDRVAEVAEKHAVPRAQVALAWVARKPGVTAPIVGATKPQHLEDAVAALDLQLSDDEIAWLEEPYVPHPVSGHQ